MGNGPYQFVTEIPIGGEGGWDILTIDSAASRLYLSHATKVVVVDLIKMPSSAKFPTRLASTHLWPYPKCNVAFRRMVKNRNRALSI